MNQRILSALAFSLVTSSVALAQNDECTGAIPAVAGVATAFDTTAATSGALAWPCAGTGGSDIWFSYTPANSGGSISIETCGSSYDTALEGFSGTCGALVSVTCNDDACGLQSTINFGPTVAGTPLHFRIGGFNGATGFGTFLVTEFGPGVGGDECAMAFPLTSGMVEATNTAAATLSAPAWPCALNGGPDVWFSYTTTIPDALLTVETCGSFYDTALEIFSGTCGALVSEGCNDDACGLQSTAIAFGGPTGSTYYIRMGGYNGAAGAGTILLTETVNPCIGQMDDALEENDTCTAATTVMSGSNTGLFCSLTDPDFYEVALAANDFLEVTLIDSVTDDLETNLYDSGCVLIQNNFGDGFLYQNLTGGAQTVVFEVFVNPAAVTTGCVTYDMDITVTAGPDCTVPDALEGGDDCFTAVPLGDGLYTDLNVDEFDNDYYEIGLDPGATVTVDIFFLDSFADTDLYLWDPLVACDTNVAGTGAASGVLELGFSTTDDEQVIYTNPTASPQTLIVEVDMWSVGGCNSYDLMISGSNGMSGGLGMNYCMANANSTGGIGMMSAVGSRVAANNDVALTASGLPNNSFGYFITSLTQGFVPNPNGSNGNLCLGGAIGRYVGSGQIMNTMGAGEFTLSLDLSMTPQPLGFVAVTAGETWNYQAWHRDFENGTVTSNFTDGLSIMYL